MSRAVHLYIFCLLSGICFSQSYDFAWPIDTPHTVTGNYGELRPNHFHMGWDFSTQGKIDFPVYAIADGYVSRLKVSAVGYGKSVYITHAGNKLSLYAHLNSYATSIATAVKNEQDLKQSYEVEFFPGKTDIKIRKGDLIGYSGNSGGSTGPHLHFEIRDKDKEVPLNLLEFYKLNDTIKPLVTKLAFYNLADTLHPVFINAYKTKLEKTDSLVIQKDSILLNQSVLGFAFSGFDRFVKNGNPNVIFTGSVYLDNKKIFTYELNDISFDNQRYVNEFSELINKNKFQKCFLPEIYPAQIYKDCIDKGRIIITDTLYHALKLTVGDEQGNNQNITFYFKVRKQNQLMPAAIASDFIDCSKPFIYSKNGLGVFIPAKTFYCSYLLSVKNQLLTTGNLLITSSAKNINSPFTLSLPIANNLKDKKNKMVLVNGSVVYNPLMINDSLVFHILSSGNFKLTKDTTGPLLKTQLSAKIIKRLKNIKSFSFIMKDYLSGIGKYKLFVNDMWVIAEYDAKSNLLTYFFDGNTPTGNLFFRVEVEDKVGNPSNFTFKLKRS